MKEDSKINYLTNIISNNTSVIPPSSVYIVPAKRTILAKADTGASRHYWTHCEIQDLKQVTPLIDGPMGKLPGNTIIQATHKGTIPLHPSLSSQAQ
eukprot:14868155-Ditylum_brightwellii.AAC.1